MFCATQLTDWIKFLFFEESGVSCWMVIHLPFVHAPGPRIMTSVHKFLKKICVSNENITWFTVCMPFLEI